MTRIGVTRAAGFVGSHFVRHALDQGHSLRALVRVGGRGSVSDGVEVVSGDVRDVDTVSTLLSGCDSVVHLAGGVSQDPGVLDSIRDGTRAVLEAVSRTDSRLVHMSCLGAEAGTHSPFYSALWDAEASVRGSAVSFVVLKSSLVLGRGDGVVSPLAAVIRALPVVPMPGKEEARTQPIDVHDFSRCLLLAATGDSLLGEVVSIGGPSFVTYRQLADLVSGELGVVKPKLLVPKPLVHAVAGLLPQVARSLYGPARIAQFHHGVVASPGIVDATFGFAPVSIVQKLKAYLN